MGEAVKLRLVFFLISILLVAGTAFADDDPETPWPLEERCVSVTTQPSEEWTFEGTIVATGWAGIHGMNAAWGTPQILAFDDGWITSGGFGTLSPDGRWYAVPQATFRPDSLYGGYADVAKLLVYDLMDRQTAFRLEWNDTYDLFFGSSSSRYYTFRTPVWFDNETIIYQRGETYYFVHVPDLEIEEWTSPSEWEGVSPVWVFISHPSPDWSRIVARIDGIELFNTETNEIIAEVYSPTANIDLPTIAWHPNSTEFILSGALSTILYDANGRLLDTISLPLEENTLDNLYIRQNAVRRQKK
ncbi:MAG: hypothetical protein SF029_09210 [bacterium]|nr:hypothetical protein [bacterium]